MLTGTSVLLHCKERVRLSNLFYLLTQSYFKLYAPTVGKQTLELDNLVEK